MSIDRRIVSILYYNEIFDINSVEKFIGEKDNFFEIIINGKNKKLKIPGKYYDDIISETDLIEEIELIEEKIEDLKINEKDNKTDEELEFLEKEEEVKELETEMELIEEDVKESEMKIELEFLEKEDVKESETKIEFIEEEEEVKESEIEIEFIEENVKEEKLIEEKDIEKIKKPEKVKVIKPISKSKISNSTISPIKIITKSNKVIKK